MNSVHDIWQKVLEMLAQQLTPTAMETWFCDCTPVELTDCRLVLCTSSELKQEIEDQLIVTRDEDGSHVRWQIS